MDRYAGKRFAGFLVAVFLVAAGYAFVESGSFASFANTVGLLYSVYLGGQSWTDSVKAKSELAE